MPPLLFFVLLLFPFPSLLEPDGETIDFAAAAAAPLPAPVPAPAAGVTVVVGVVETGGADVHG